MTYTNLNIVSENGAFKYIVEYKPTDMMKTTPLELCKNDVGCFFHNNELTNVLHNKNFWEECKETDIKEFIPTSWNTCVFDIYFPRFSVDTYNKNVYYVLTMNTWIANTCVYLCSIVFKRYDAVAVETGFKTFMNDKYYEHISIETPDPTYIIYSDEWKEFRENICKEITINGSQLNNTGSSINITLTPVRKIDDTWIKLDEYDSAQNVISIKNDLKNTFMNAELKFNSSERTFDCKLLYNDFYKNLDEYLYETYQMNTKQTDDNSFSMQFGLVVRDKENAYKYITHKYTTPKEFDTFVFDEFSYENWDDFCEGLYANVLIIMQINGNDSLVLTSNSVQITQDIYKFFIQQNITKHINLDNIDMNVQKLDVVNIIKNEIVTVERPNDYKANIIKPVFVKVQEADAIRLHKSVIENIVINLDQYKNKVEQFTIKIGETNSTEIGRINSGIVFKIIGSGLPEETEGLYYILNQDGELVTTGNYTII